MTFFKVNSLIVLVTCIVCIIAGNGVSANNRIVGGFVADDGAFPYQVSLRILEKHHFCGGSILNEYWILTAAHCLYGMTADNISVVAGTNLLNSGGDRYKVEALVLHDRYMQLFQSNNDIGLIKVKEPIVFGKNVQPIKLAKENTSADVKLTLSGWGHTNSDPSKNNTPPNELQAIHLTSISYLKCKLAFIGQVLAVISTNHLCTLTKEGEGACNGDSGGPLVHGEYQVGVVSWGIPCAKGKPDVFTRVFNYIPWIKNNIETITTTSVVPTEKIEN